MHGARASARDDRNKGETLRKLISLVVLVGALVWAAPAGAIINGEPDGNDHPYVGMTFNDEFVCSGTLISPTVFLTAGHCADFLKVPEQGDGWVTFQEDGQAFPEDVPVASAHTYPGFCNDGAFTVPDCPGGGILGFAQNDVGVVILAEPVTMSTYGQLPPLNVVDTLPIMQPVTQVGYGVRVHLKKVTDEVFQRYQTDAGIIRAAGQKWTDQFYRVTANFGQDKGGVCFGDSGGPDFLDDSTTVLGVHSLVNNVNCSGVTWTARVDTPAIQSWIRSFL